MERDDLGVLFGQITRRLVEAERPLLAASGLSMWGYIALTHLSRSPASSQLAMAQAIGHDKTRLIPLLDELQRDGLITRSPDPADRRAHTVRLTPAGEDRQGAAQASVRAMESELLSALSATEVRLLREVLARLGAEHQQ